MIQILSPSRHLISFDARAKNFSRISRMDVSEKSRFSLPISEHFARSRFTEILISFYLEFSSQRFFPLIKPSHHVKVSKFCEGKF